jgi:hypothetical protein
MRRQFFFSIAIVAALTVGVLFASVGTSISTPCPPALDDPSSHCVSYQKVHLDNLTSNTQDSLTRFLFNFLVGSVVFSGLLVVLSFFVSRRRSDTYRRSSSKRT